MSNVLIRKALETAFEVFNNGLGAAKLETSWENVDFKPIDGLAYQAVYILFAAPDNPTITAIGQEHYRQAGFMQVSLRYPTNTGPGGAQARAEALRRAFFRGLSLIADGVTTIIDRTPEVPSGAIDGDRYVINVRIRFYANIFEGV